MMEDESLVWTSNDVVIVLQHQNEMIPLRYVVNIIVQSILKFNLCAYRILTSLRL